MHCHLEEIDAALAPAVSTPLHILIVEDDAFMARWVMGHMVTLRREFPRSRIEIVHTLAEGVAMIKAENPPNITFLDLTLLDSPMVETIKIAPVLDKRTAVVIVTGHKTEEVERMLVGAKIEVLNKKALSGDGIVQAAVRALMRHERADNERRMQENRDILAHLTASGYGPTQESQ